MFSAPDAYDRFVGRYSTLLSSQMADLAGVVAGQRVLDVGSGPGALTAELVRRVGADHVSAVDPSEPNIAVLRQRYPGVDARVASAEALPLGDASFDAALAQLVVHFMQDPLAGVREMARVTRRGGVVAACVWDGGGERSPLGPFWRVARELDPTLAQRDVRRLGQREGELLQLFSEAGLRDASGTTVAAAVTHPTFEAWWESLALGVGPAATFISSLDSERRQWLRERLRHEIPTRDFRHETYAWAARGIV